ncbi:hypothetical protein [uncultured Rikenella sp.]|uniref:hypothetical protein n=1 Tax=uncultured Rikenella sp. TaxID=368003 RepID=UPI00262C8A98|nr:hypothetical protein [uncultured Rikenella sp.]
MKTNRRLQVSPVSKFESLILRLEQIRSEFYRQIPDSDEIDQNTFENAINEAQTVIGVCMAQQLVDRCRREKGGRAL